MINVCYSGDKKAEVKMAMATVKHNAPFQMADTISPIIRECFKDSK